MRYGLDYEGMFMQYQDTKIVGSDFRFRIIMTYIWARGSAHKIVRELIDFLISLQKKRKTQLNSNSIWVYNFIVTLPSFAIGSS